MRQLFLIAAAALLTGCVVHGSHPAPAYPPAPVAVHPPGPPPHAPAHGYRTKHGGVDLRFDTGIGVYLVLGHPDYYWWDDHYWWFHDGVWQWSVSWGGSYVNVGDPGRVPPGLAKKHGKGQDKDKGKGKGKDKDKK
jgi:hypothetical protein